jgi:hypothetical protein
VASVFTPEAGTLVAGAEGEVLREGILPGEPTPAENNESGEPPSAGSLVPETSVLHSPELLTR